MSYPLTSRVCMEARSRGSRRRERHHFMESAACPAGGVCSGPRLDIHSIARHNVARYRTEVEACMPVAKVYVPEGLLTQDQRRESVKGIHDVIVGVQKRPADSPTYVLVNEIPARDWGATGNVYVPRT